MPKKVKYTTLEYVLLSLVPYTTPNLKLAYKPGLFFAELEYISNSNRNTLQATLARAQQQGLVERINGVPRLTKRGQDKIAPYKAAYVQNANGIMVIFDIPEEYARQRRRFRLYLKEREFELVQKSVWLSHLDHRSELYEIMAELKIGKYVQIFEAFRLFPKD